MQCVRRLNASHKAAEEYIQQFPSPTIRQAESIFRPVGWSLPLVLQGIACPP